MENNEEVLKQCTICGVSKPLEEFWHHKNMKYGRYSSCRSCCSIKNKEEYINNKERIAARNKRDYEKNKERYLSRAKQRYEEKSEEIVENVTQWVKENPKRAKSNWKSSALKRKYGITSEQYQELLDRQNGKCAICDKEADKQKGHFHVDHAHTDSDFIPAGMIRGLLCWTCNLKLIGKNTNPKIFEKAAEYLKQHTGWMVPSDQINPKKKRRKRK